jgi:hypothetical protein
VDAVAGHRIYKSTSAEFLDELFGGDDAESLNAAFERSLGIFDSIGGAPLSEAAAQLADTGELPRKAVEQSQTGWRAGPVVDRIIRAGYLEAIRRAQDRPEPVPIETFWVTGTSDEFEVHLCDGKRRVTLFLFIPVDDREYGSERADTTSWIVRAGGADDADVMSLLDDDDPPIVIQQGSGARSAAS